MVDFPRLFEGRAKARPLPCLEESNEHAVDLLFALRRHCPQRAGTEQYWALT